MLHCQKMEIAGLEELDVRKIKISERAGRIEPKCFNICLLRLVQLGRDPSARYQDCYKRRRETRLDCDRAVIVRRRPSSNRLNSNAAHYLNSRAPPPHSLAAG